jgi:transglutaminase-like putative cysteine protease
MDSDPYQEFLKPSLCVNSDNPEVHAFTAAHVEVGATQQGQAVSLYYAVRDGFRYDPYRIDFSPTGMSASRVIENGYGHCIAKAALLAACARHVGIPARLGFADVRNHLTSKKLREVMETDVFAWHGFTELWLDGAWVRATPAFDLALCEKAGTLPLEFNGKEDSVYHPLDKSGKRHMEYLQYRGTYVDVPIGEIVSTYIEMYPKAAKGFAEGSWGPRKGSEGNFQDEVAKE